MRSTTKIYLIIVDWPKTLGIKLIRVLAVIMQFQDDFDLLVKIKHFFKVDLIHFVNNVVRFMIWHYRLCLHRGFLKVKLTFNESDMKFP